VGALADELAADVTLSRIASPKLFGTRVLALADDDRDVLRRLAREIFSSMQVEASYAIRTPGAPLKVSS